jgi:hypothetical protein
MLGRKRKKKERGNKDMQGLQYYNVAMLQYCNAVISTLQLPAISKWANWSAKQNLHHQKQRQQGKATSMSKQNNINIKAKYLTKSIDPGVIFG